MTTAILIFIVLILVLATVIVFMVKALLKAHQENKSLQETIKRQKSSINLLMNHIEETKKIQQKTATTAEEIKNAESDEDINKIIADIIASNNSKL